MVKKTLPYMVTAIVLGVMVMLLPLRLLYTVPAQTFENRALCYEYLEGIKDTHNLPASITCPSSPLFTGLTFVLSFVFALGVSIYVKRKIL